jgi:UDPglucose--hexose-1-phosphate uridylyltransferase
MSPEPAAGRWEQRWHPLRREWVVYSAHRNDRPWDGKREPPPPPAPSYEPTCYLCPGNRRVHGDINPDYRDVFIFDNDHPVVGRNAPAVETGTGLYRRVPATGLARVICYDPRHNVNMTDLPLARAVRVFEAWKDQTRDMARTAGVEAAFFFENKGRLVGTSNTHPHCQMYALNFTPRQIVDEMSAATAHRQATGNDLFADILAEEARDGRRIVAENAGAVAFIPFFARWAYEAWIFPKQRHATLETLTEPELRDLCDVYQQVTRRYDLLYGMVFPYVMGLYQAPLKGGPFPDYHLHFVILPPLRQPGLQKFLAGSEIHGGNFMADTLPEEKAAELKAVDLSAYREVP